MSDFYADLKPTCPELLPDSRSAVSLLSEDARPAQLVPRRAREPGVLPFDSILHVGLLLNSAPSMAAVGSHLRSAARLWSRVIRSSRLAASSTTAAGRLLPAARFVSTKPSPSVASAAPRAAAKPTSANAVKDLKEASPPSKWLVIEGLPEGTTSDGTLRRRATPSDARAFSLIQPTPSHRFAIALQLLCEVHGAEEARVGRDLGGLLTARFGWVAFASTWHATGALVSLTQSGIDGSPVKVSFVAETFLEDLVAGRRPQAAGKALDLDASPAPTTPADVKKPPTLPSPPVSRWSLLPVAGATQEEAAPETFLPNRDYPPTAGLRIKNLPFKSDLELREVIELYIPDRPFSFRRRQVYLQGQRQPPSTDEAPIADLTFGSVEDATAAKTTLEAVAFDGYHLAIQYQAADKVEPLEVLLRRAALSKARNGRVSCPPADARSEADQVQVKVDANGNKVVVATRGVRLIPPPGVALAELADEVVALLRHGMDGRRYHLECREMSSSSCVDLTFANPAQAAAVAAACKDVRVGGQPIDVSFRRSKYVGTLDEDGGLIRAARERRNIIASAKPPKSNSSDPWFRVRSSRLQAFARAH